MPQNDQARDKGSACGAGDSHLTAREADVLVQLASDKRTYEIARTLGISVRTVEQHLAIMMRRANVQTRPGLIARCYAVGILLNQPEGPVWSGSRCLHIPSDVHQPGHLALVEMNHNEQRPSKAHHQKNDPPVP